MGRILLMSLLYHLHAQYFFCRYVFVLRFFLHNQSMRLLCFTLLIYKNIKYFKEALPRKSRFFFKKIDLSNIMLTFWTSWSLKIFLVPHFLKWWYFYFGESSILNIRKPWYVSNYWPTKASCILVSCYVLMKQKNNAYIDRLIDLVGVYIVICGCYEQIFLRGRRERTDRASGRAG